MSQLRQFVRRFVPDAIRKPLGAMVGWLDHHFIRTIQGAIFDLGGGRFRADGCEFAIPTGLTSMNYRSCFFRGDYEAEEREIVRNFVRPADSVLEIGACLGIVSCVTNKILADKSKHVVVEGNPLCIPALERNRELNKSGFTIENCAVSTKPDAKFYLHPVYVVGGSTQRQSSRPANVPARPLAALDAQHGPFTALIMDVEGAEMEIFSASLELLRRYRLVIVELHEWAIGARDVERCREILTEAGLKFKLRAGITEAWQRD